jgi:hypothetical protein
MNGIILVSNLYLGRPFISWWIQFRGIDRRDIQGRLRKVHTCHFTREEAIVWNLGDITMDAQVVTK